MRSLLRPALVLFTSFSLLTGLAYPALVTALAHLAFPAQAGGSLVTVNGRVVGSALVGQPFDEPRYFWGRPSATVRFPDDASASQASNLGPTNPRLAEAVRARVAALRGDGAGPVPVDLVTASASGLDPHVSPAAARFQVRRVARARGLDEAVVAALVERHVEGRLFGVWGEPRVNVLRLNLALDALSAGGS